MEDNKKILLSGRLSGTRTFTSELEKIANPDTIEEFLLFFSKLMINETELQSKQIIHIYNDDTFLEVNDIISNSKFISIYHTEDFSKLYITIDSIQTYIIDLANITTTLLSNFISKETPIKYAINSFNFIKWCNLKNIDIKSLYDIPTYIKLLTNDVDPFKTPIDYLTTYSSFKCGKNIEKINIAICNFIYKFGNVISKYIEEFDLATVSRLINENSYYEGKTFNNTGNCTIELTYKNVDTAISNIIKTVSEKYETKAYIISPLNRIAPKFKQDITSLIHEIYSEDLSITILNELYNNNIPVKLDYETNKYIITCKFKNYSTMLNILLAIFSEVFTSLFEQSPEIYLESSIKE